jgi:hypothetical protein
MKNSVAKVGATQPEVAPTFEIAAISVARDARSYRRSGALTRDRGGVGRARCALLPLYGK